MAILSVAKHSLLLTLITIVSFPAFAQMVGGGFFHGRESINGFINANDWQINQSPLNGVQAISAGELQLTDGQILHQTTCAFYKKQFYVQKGFEVSFVYNATSGNNSVMADGAVFVLQSQSINAIGPGGGNLGFFKYIDDMGKVFQGISPGAGLALNLYKSSIISERRNVGYKLVNSHEDVFYTTNVNGPFDFIPYDELLLQKDISVSLKYDRTTRVVSGTIQVQGGSTEPMTASNVNLNQLLNNKKYWVGFCGATGGTASKQVIKNFRFTAY